VKELRGDRRGEEKGVVVVGLLKGVKGKGRDWGFVVQRRKKPNT